MEMGALLSVRWNQDFTAQTEHALLAWPFALNAPQVRIVNSAIL